MSSQERSDQITPAEVWVTHLRRHTHALPKGNEWDGVLPNVSSVDVLRPHKGELSDLAAELKLRGRRILQQHLGKK